jgi:hypothetical protein
MLFHLSDTFRKKYKKLAAIGGVRGGEVGERGKKGRYIDLKYVNESGMR